MTVAFYVNGQKPCARREVVALSRECARLGLRIVPDVTAGSCDVLVALGGDGTILRAVREFPRLPVVGFNLGGLGYLASVVRGEFRTALAELAAGRFAVVSRSMIEASVGRSVFVALNEIVIMREMTGHAAILDVSFDGGASMRYMADGLVVATPTGSTAYSLSAGGPVLMPDTPCLAVTPMNPHALGVRPIVVNDRTHLKITSRRLVNGDVERLGVYADGEAVFMLDGDSELLIRKSRRTAKLVALDGYDPAAVLGRKFRWSGGGVP